MYLGRIGHLLGLVADFRPWNSSTVAVAFPRLRREFFKDIIAEGAVEYLEYLGMRLSALLRMHRAYDRYLR